MQYLLEVWGFLNWKISWGSFLSALISTDPMTSKYSPDFSQGRASRSSFVIQARCNYPAPGVCVNPRAAEIEPGVTQCWDIIVSYTDRWALPSPLTCPLLFAHLAHAAASIMQHGVGRGSPFCWWIFQNKPQRGGGNRLLGFLCFFIQTNFYSIVPRIGSTKASLFKINLSQSDPKIFVCLILSQTENCIRPRFKSLC